jgi:ADP-heptose:LPS heptosyltransferase
MKLLMRKRTYPTFSLKQYAEKRNRILFIRQVGGLGDILMHCMMFEDIKNLHPDLTVVWALPKVYCCIGQMHKYVDEVVNIDEVDTNDYVIFYNTTHACREHEMKRAPYADKNRSDIWANHCGVYLRNHRFNLELPQENLENGQRILNQINLRGQRSILLSPVSSTIAKDLTDAHLEAISLYARRNNFCLIGVHTSPIMKLKELGIPVVYGLSIPDWMGLIHAADYVVSVDTAAVHYAGGIGKPTVGIFTYADGKIYGKYYSKFVLVQRHRDDGDWDCGPCYNWSLCPKEKGLVKPCITEISVKMLICGINNMLEKYPLNTTLM